MKAIEDLPDRGLLGRLDNHVAQAMLTLGHPIGYPPGTQLLRRGGEDRHALLLLRGAVKIQAGEPDDPALLAVRAAGDLVGEMAALDDRPRSATVIAGGEVVARLIPPQEFRRFLQRHPEVLLDIARDNNDELRWANRLRQAVPLPAESRIALVLDHLVRRYGHRTPDGRWSLELHLTNIELASIAGMRARTAEQAFSRLRDAGIVLTGTRRVLLVPRIDRLTEATRMDSRPTPAPV
ncbi:Crp/Fnr family transcriptional regulator [Saccharothrix saharensis]|uniref:Crp/Fnr family transcriptional regulator n=1 Tax=Saccharothrix saharensis TaxID=571190 RepID=UPI001478A6F3|nr:Crp/Fnr family transcriptional regulator [Saccharothrix saharensis]